MLRDGQQVHGVFGAERSPGLGGDATLHVSYTFAHGKQPSQLRTAKLSQSVKRPHTGVRIDLDQIEINAFEILLLKPIQQLEKLQLVVKIMLKPEHNILMLAEILERPVASGKVGAQFFIVTPAKSSECLRADVGQFA